MGTKVILYVTILIATVSLYFNITSETEYINTRDTLKIGATTFQLDSITKKLYAQLDTFTKPKPKIIEKWITKYDTIKGDSIFITSTDTIYPARFYVHDSYIDITGTTYYSLHGINTFDIEYIIKPTSLELNTFWIKNKVVNELYRNGEKVHFVSNVNYDEFNKYVESLKPKFYEKPYFVSGATAIIIGGLFFLIK